MISPAVTNSPAYIFDLDEFKARCEKVKTYLKDISLTYSMKANPFLLEKIPESIGHIEVCSPGELRICMKMGIPADRIIYSGVMKEQKDVNKAVNYGVDLLTAESILHAQLEQNAVKKYRTSLEEKRKVILRLTSGNQFGMSEDDIEYLIAHKDEFYCLDFYGIHYYSGTQKKMRQIKKDFLRIEKLLDRLKEKYDFEPKLIEYGPGASVDYFEAPYDETDWKHFEEVSGEILAFSEKYPIGIEMGRFLASSCGRYITQVKDSKMNNETNYLIVDGGIHQLKYYGQTMAMQIPPITLMDKNGKDIKFNKEDQIPYMICGSLCTTADILVREVNLPKINKDDYLVFHRCGAYSVTEGSLFFLSRSMPRIFVTDGEKGLRMLRNFIKSGDYNMSGEYL